MTAVAEDHQVALSMGISVKRSIAFAWVLGALLSTLGAVIFLSGKSLNFLASEIGFAALPVALLAGLESIAGLLLAGAIVGAVQGLATAYLDPLVGGAVGSVLPFVIMLLILLVRPTGLFGWRTIERV
jgi:branched-chain amino acid transport system permease protein